MSNTPQDGEPAFPMPHFTDQGAHTHWGYHGMTLRDWFAGQALAGICGGPADERNRDNPAIVRGAYMIADAMLDQRAKARTP